MHHCALKILFTTFISAIFVEGLHLTHRGELPPLKRKAPIPPNEDTLNELKGILRKRVLDDNQMEFSQYLKDEKEALQALEAGLEDKLQKFASGLAFEADFYASISSSVKQSSNGFDPFRVCKFSELVREETKCYISDISTKLLDFTDETLMTETLEQVLELSLWGTRREILDLSPKPELSAAEKNAAAFGNNVQFAVSEEKKRRMSPKMKKAMFNNVLQDNRRLIYKNFASVDTDSIYQVVEFLRSIRFDETSLANEDNRKVHIITDKVGHGLVADLLLGHVLLCLNICSSVSYHCRPYSSGSVLSVTGADISGTIEEMADPQKGGDLWNVRHFGEALRRHVVTGKMHIKVDEFWCQTHIPLWKAPEHIVDQLQNGACTFVKGDEMYLRMLGDIDWPEESSQHDMLSYWPSPLCVLRTRGSKGAVTLVS